MKEIMAVKIGDTLVHGGEKFVIMDIRHDEHIEKKVLVVHACDPDTANKEQERALKMEQTGQNVVDLLRKLTDQGGGLSLGGGI